MKVIDLLNKIENNEIKEGTKFKIDGCAYIYNNGYISNDDTNKTMETFYISQILLNDEVEIIEEDEDIEELKIEQDGNTYYIKNEYGTKYYLTKHSYLIADKVNELAREINKLKGKNKYE